MLYVVWECRGNSGTVRILFFARVLYLFFANENYLNWLPTRAVLFAIMSVIPCKWLLFEKLVFIHLTHSMEQSPS